MIVDSSHSRRDIIMMTKKGKGQKLGNKSQKNHT